MVKSGNTKASLRVKFWVLTANHQEWRIFGGFRCPSCFGADQILAILCRANSPEVTKGLCKVLLGLEAAGNGDVQHSRIGSTQHRLSTLKPLAQRSEEHTSELQSPVH